MAGSILNPWPSVKLSSLASPCGREPGWAANEIIDAIGKGGMGEVYRARDARLQRLVAIKTVASHAMGHPQFRERFEREARAVVALSHPKAMYRPVGIAVGPDGAIYVTDDKQGRVWRIQAIPSRTP